jgi:hypothetical protein
VGVAWAQRLEFDGAGVFKTGAEASLTGEIDALRRWVVDNTPKATTPVTKVQLRVRELAAGLLQSGSNLAEEGSIHVMMGRRIVARLADLDAEVTRAGAGPDGASKLEKFLADCPTDPAIIPTDPADLDRVIAAVFAPFAGIKAGAAPARRAWIVTGLDPELSSVEAMTQAVADLRGAGVSVGAGVPTPAALDAPDRQLVVQAARAAAKPVKWLSPDAKAKIGALVGDALTRIGAPGTVRSARTDLARAALLGDILTAIDGARLTARQTRVMRAVGESLSRSVEAGSSDCDDALGALRRGLRLMQESEAVRWKESGRLVREVRPLWKEVEMEARRTRDEALETLGRLQPTSPALSDPGVLASLAGLGRVMDDARAVCVISAWLTGSPEPGNAGRELLGAGADAGEGVTLKTDRVRRLVGVRLLALPVKVRRDESRDAALGVVRELARGLDEWFPLPGEAAMRSGASAWQGLTGNALVELTAAADVERAAWLSDWSGAKDPAANAGDDISTPTARLGMLRELASMSQDVLAVEAGMQGPPTSGIRAWPGFALPGRGESIVGALRSEISRLGAMVRTGDYQELDKALVHVRGHAKIVHTLALLDDAARARHVAQAPMTEELAGSPTTWQWPVERVTPGVWLGEARENVAALSRALEEHLAATKGGERERWTALQRFMVAECDLIQRALQAGR